MKLFHGSYSSIAPVIKIGANAMSGDNLFDGLFASADREIADSHGGLENSIHCYEVSNIAESSDLNARIDEVIAFLYTEIEAESDVLEALAYAIADDEETDEFNDVLSPRSFADHQGAFSWELQRLRGRVAAHLGFDAVEMSDEHGISYLIVNPKITAI